MANYSNPYHNELYQRALATLMPLMSEAVRKGIRPEYVATILATAAEASAELVTAVVNGETEYKLRHGK